jgi:hypothetical protein
LTTGESPPALGGAFPRPTVWCGDDEDDEDAHSPIAYTNEYEVPPLDSNRSASRSERLRSPTAVR